MMQGIEAATGAQTNVSGIAEQSAGQAAQGFAQLGQQILSNQAQNLNQSTGATMEALKSGAYYQNALEQHTGAGLAAVSEQIQAAKRRADAAAKAQQDMLDDAEADKQALRMGYEQSSMRDKAIATYGGDVNNGLDWFKKQVDEQINSKQMKDLSKSNPRIYKQLTQFLTTKAAENAEKLKGKLLERKTADEIEAFKMDVADYKVKAGRLNGDLGKLQELTNLFGSEKQQKRAANLQGTTGLNMLNDAQKAGFKNFLLADTIRQDAADPLSTNPERALKNLETGFFRNVLEQDEISAIQKDLLEAVKKKNDAQDYIQEQTTNDMKYDAEVIYSKGKNARSAGDLDAVDDARAKLTAMKEAYIKTLMVPNSEGFFVVDSNKSKVGAKTVEFFTTKISSLATEARGIENDTKRAEREQKMIANQAATNQHLLDRKVKEAAKEAETKRLTSDDAVNARTKTQQAYETIQNKLGSNLSNMQGTKEEYAEIKKTLDQLVDLEHKGFVDKDANIHRTWENQVAYLRMAGEAARKKYFAPKDWFGNPTGEQADLNKLSPQQQQDKQKFFSDFQDISNKSEALRYATAPAPKEVQQTFNFTGDPKEAERLNQAQRTEYQRLVDKYKPQNNQQRKILYYKAAGAH